MSVRPYTSVGRGEDFYSGDPCSNHMEVELFLFL